MVVSNERNYQGLDDALIVPGEVTCKTREVVGHDRLGELLGFHDREAD